MKNLKVVKRTIEPLREIEEFYRSVGYGGRVSESDRIYLTYIENRLVCVLKIAIENDVAVLRGMYMSESIRGMGFGKKILKEIEPELRMFNKECYCVPKKHLQKFYNIIGFIKVENDSAPTFLIERVKNYVSSGHNVIIMKRAKETSCCL